MYVCMYLYRIYVYIRKITHEDIDYMFQLLNAFNI